MSSANTSCQLKRFYLALLALPLFILLLFTNSNKVKAGYEYCETKIENTDLYDCGKYAYTYYEAPGYSSKIKANRENASILYVGNMDGTELFYASGFRYYNVSHDDRTSADNNLWAVLSSRGRVIYSGEFKDAWQIDDSHEGYYIYALYDEVYTIRQYSNSGKNLVRQLVVYNYDTGEFSFTNAYFNDVLLGDEVNEVVPLNDDFTIDIQGRFGVRSVKVIINGNEIPSTYENGQLKIGSYYINENLVKGEVSKIEITVTDYLGLEETKTYRVLFVNESVSIRLSTMTSVIETTSRRIVIKAIPGKGKSLDTDYCWYYWSTSPDDSLNYDEFLLNYARSDYKGSYSENKGVILRNTNGTYYLYALAKDEDSSVVIRSEGYVLTNNNYRYDYRIMDGIVVMTLLICSIIPIYVYLHIRKKGY